MWVSYTSELFDQTMLRNMLCAHSISTQGLIKILQSNHNQMENAELITGHKSLF